MTALVTNGVNAGPAWSPTGREIAYVHTDEDDVTDLWIMNADGSDQTRLTTTGGVLAAAPSWSPDGEPAVVWRSVPARRPRRTCDLDSSRNLS